jgi:hypothetical protein
MDAAPADFPDPVRLFAVFGNQLPAICEVVPADSLPEPYHGLLVHEDHMTVTLEAYYGKPVEVRVLDRRQAASLYARKILLTLQAGGRVVLFGIVRIDLDVCSPAVRQAILSEILPLGRILIEFNVMRRIEPTAFLRIETDQELSRWFGVPALRTTFGRLGIIHCEQRPAIELLEIVAPE